jgi:hypothetical protein
MAPVLRKIRLAKSAPCAVADVQHLDPLCLLDDPVDDAIDVRLMPI